MDKLKLESPNLTEENIEKIGKLFPNALTEMRDEEGNLKKGIDFEILKQELSGDVIDGEECYDFTWVGKKKAIVEANTPIRKTLRPCLEESKDWENTENLYIEGDNLDVLKLLQESYLNKVKMIYIDPPYNTGSDSLVYSDRFVMDEDEYEEGIEYRDEEGNINFRQNTETNPRFHSDWCSNMYSRLKLARTLLRDDGVIFVSIDDTEVSNLKKICDEIFGIDNLINILIWKKRYNAAKEKHLAIIHEYILIYSKNRVKVSDFLVQGHEDYYKNLFKEADEYISTRGKFMTQPLEAGNSMDLRPNLRFPITAPDGVEVWPRRQWVWGTAKVEKAIKEGRLKFYKSKDDQWRVRHKHYERDDEGKRRRIKPFTIYDKCFTQDGTKEINSLIGNNIFPFPKPSTLIKHMIELSDEKDSIYLDFFSGSATTAHAVMQLNAEDGGNRKFIMVQLPEETDEKSEAFKAGYKNISEIGKERIRRAGEKIKQDNQDKESIENLDIGFRVFKVDSTNMKDVYYSANEYDQGMLDNLISNIKEDRNDLDLLYGVLIDWGLPLSLKHEMEEIDGVTVHTVDQGSLVACFADQVPEKVIREIAKRKPLRVVFRDSSFASSPEKINVEEIFKLHAPNTAVRVI